MIVNSDAMPSSTEELPRQQPAGIVGGGYSQRIRASRILRSGRLTGLEDSFNDT